jgi:hypothetical protein
MIPALPDGTVELAIKGTNQGLPWACICHAKAVLTGTPTTGDAGVMAQRYHVGWAGQFIPVQSDQIELHTVDATLWYGGGLTLDGTYSNVVIGEDSGAPLPASAAVLVSLKVSERWRGGHGRMYIPGIVDDRLDTVNSYSGATITDFQDAYDAFKAYVNGVSSTHIDSATQAVVRRFADGGSLTIPPTYLDPPEVLTVTAGVVRSHVASQRRRLGPF